MPRQCGALLALLHVHTALASHVAIAHLNTYPGVITSVRATLKLEAIGSDLLRVSGYITGLAGCSTAGCAIGAIGGWHVHGGYSCGLASDVGESLFTSATTLCFNSVTANNIENPCYVADSKGVAFIDKQIRGFSLTGSTPTLGRTIVVHDSSGVRVACGIVEPLHGETVDVGVYPGTSVPLSYALTRGLLHVTEEGDAATNFVRPSSSSFNVRGSVRIVTQGGSAQATQLMSVSLRGADPACASGPGSATGSCGITLNLETSCAGTSFTPLPGALMSYTSTSDGTIQTQRAASTGYNAIQLTGKALLVHDYAGARIACALIGSGGDAVRLTPLPAVYPLLPPSPIPPTPLPTPPPQVGTGLRIRGILTGLAPNAVGVSFHIHTGSTCATASPPSAVGGHYFPRMPVDPWLNVTGQPDATATDKGVATVDYSIGDSNVMNDCH